MQIEDIIELSNFLNAQANLPVKVQRIADLLKEELSEPIETKKEEAIIEENNG
jgi:hypothetical protein